LQYLEKLSARKFLIRVPNWVGDAVICLPALQALRAQHPSAHLAVLARPSVAAIFEREPYLDEVIHYNAPKAWSGLGAKLRAASDLRREHFECAILFQNAFEAAAVAWLSRIGSRIGYDRDARGWLLTQAIPVPKPGETPRHQRFYYLELLKRAGLIDDYPEQVEVRMSRVPEAALSGRRRLSELGIESPVVGVSPGAAFGGAKRWLPERFGAAAAVLAGQRKAVVAIFGGPGEKEACDDVERAVNAHGVRCRNFGGRTTLSEFIELVAACDLFLTNDSGPMHVACGLDIPTVAVFGATDAEATGPAGRESVVVREPVPCSPCLLRECPIDHRCMTGVSVRRVVEAADELVALSK
jgi:heptosyltransferase II